jgi:hypothetical protein
MTGAFADPSFPAPTEAGYTARRYPWVGLPGQLQGGHTGDSNPRTP